MKNLLCLACLLLGTSLCFAEGRSPDVGEAVPEITDADWVLNAPEGKFSLERYRGRVVLIQQWWFPCPACRSTFSWLDERYDEFHDQGLEVFAFEQMSTRGDAGAAQATKEAILALIAEKGGVSYPVSRGGTSQNYRGSFEFPYFWLVDIDGKVVFHEEAQGPHYATTRAKLLELIPQELERIRTPQLGLELDPKLEKAVALYDAGRYEAALGETDKATKRTEDEAILSDAARLRDAVAERSAKLLTSAEQLVEEGKYLEAIDSFAFIQSAFGKHETGKTAAARIKAMKKDKTIKKELKALEKLEKLLAKLEAAPADYRNRALAKFIEANAGTHAATRAAAARQ